jgi:membrane protein
MSTFIEKIKKWGFIQRTINRADRWNPKMLGGASFYDVGRLFVKGINEGALPMRASSLAYNFFMAIFPSIIFLFTLIPYIPIPDLQDQLFNLLKEFMPRNAFEAAEETLYEVIKKPHSGLLSFGFIAALYFSTNGFNSMLTGFNESYHVTDKRSALAQRLTAMLLNLVLTITLLLGIALIIASEWAIYETNKKIKTLVHLNEKLANDVYWIETGRNGIVLFLLFSIVGFIYFFGQRIKSKRHFISVGAVFTTIGIIVTSLGFAYYVNNFGQYNKLYGSIGTLIVIMLWIYFNSLILLLGFELNASIDNAHKQLAIEEQADNKEQKLAQ